MIFLGFEVAKNPVIMQVSGVDKKCETISATLLQQVCFKKVFATDDVVQSGLQVED